MFKIFEIREGRNHRLVNNRYMQQAVVEMIGIGRHIHPGGDIEGGMRRQIGRLRKSITQRILSRYRINHFGNRRQVVDFI